MSDLQRKTGSERRRAPVQSTPRSTPAQARGLVRRGVSVVEVLVVLAIMILFALWVIMALPRQTLARRAARMVACQRNLMQIGVALALYDQSQRSLPSVVELGGAAAAHASGPLKALLMELGLADLNELTDPQSPPPKRRVLSHSERRIPGFFCASDRNATAGSFAAPVSYRASTGDSPDGRHGAFAPGRHVSIAQIEASDGSSYTAGFAERLVGDHRLEHPAPANFALVPGPLGSAGCPRSAPTAWRGDAGVSWVACDWQSTLYNHALTPNAAPSCIALDRRSAFMGASSAHPDGVNVLVLDGSVRTFTPTIETKIWREWAAVPEAPRDPP